MEFSAYLLSPEKWGILFLTGLIAGIFNTMAAGGTLITLPILIFMGLPTAVANGTNRIAIFFQSLSAIYVFQRKGKLNFRLAFLVSGPSILGCIWGAHLAVDLSDAFFRKFLSVMMLVVVGLILWNPGGHHSRERSIAGWRNPIPLAAVFFFIGMYGGLVMAGIGFFIIAAFTLIAKIDLIQANAQKALIIGIFNIAGLMIFLLNGKVDGPIGAVLALGQGIGGWLGSRWAIQKGEKWIRAFLLISVVAMALRLAGLIPGWG